MKDDEGPAMPLYVSTVDTKLKVAEMVAAKGHVMVM